MALKINPNNSLSELVVELTIKEGKGQNCLPHPFQTPMPAS